MAAGNAGSAAALPRSHWVFGRAGEAPAWRCFARSGAPSALCERGGTSLCRADHGSRQPGVAARDHEQWRQPYRALHGAGRLWRRRGAALSDSAVGNSVPAFAGLLSSGGFVTIVAETGSLLRGYRRGAVVIVLLGALATGATLS